MEDDLIEKAKQFEETIKKLGTKKPFSKKDVEKYHSEMESRVDDNMTKFEDAITKEYQVEKMRENYNRLSIILEGGILK